MLKKIRAEKIDELVNRIAEWEHNDLVAYIQETYRHELTNMDEKRLSNEWEECFGDITPEINDFTPFNPDLDTAE